MHEGGTGERVERLVGPVHVRHVSVLQQTETLVVDRGRFGCDVRVRVGCQPPQYPWRPPAPSRRRSVRRTRPLLRPCRGRSPWSPRVCGRRRPPRACRRVRGHRAGADGLHAMVVPVVDGCPFAAPSASGVAWSCVPAAPSSPPWAWPRALGDTIAAVASASTHSGITTQTATLTRLVRVAAAGIASASAHRATIAISRTAAVTSTNPVSCTLPCSGPNGMPTVRVQAHAATNSRFVTHAMTSAAFDGRRAKARASPSWSHPATANTTPSVSHSPACDVAMAKWMAPAPNDSDASATRIGTPSSVSFVGEGGLSHHRACASPPGSRTRSARSSPSCCCRTRSTARPDSRSTRTCHLRP